MGKSTGPRIEFRVVHQSGDASLFDLHQAYWSGQFETRERSRVEGTPPGLDEPVEASRDSVSRWVGWGSIWLPAEIRKMSSNRQRWSAMARISRLDFKDFADWWLSAFGRFTIPRRDLDKWLEDRRVNSRDSIRHKIENVLDAASRIAEERPNLTHRSIAGRLLSRRKGEGYTVDAIKKILAGTYLPQVRREIPGLRGRKR